MRTGVFMAAAAALLGGCFDEGGDAGNTQAALTMADGLMAFPDIQNNLQTDPGAAAVGLLAFIKTPVAANNLVAPPFDLASMDSELVAPPTGVPECLTTSGPAGCDSFTTNSLCEAGNFTFSGSASRTCAPCENVAGVCTYNWQLDLTYARNGLEITVHTSGPQMASASEVSISSDWDFGLTNAGFITGGSLHIESCGPATIKPGPPRRLVNAQFFVTPRYTTGAYLGVCAHVFFDGDGNPSTKSDPRDKTSCGCL